MDREKKLTLVDAGGLFPRLQWTNLFSGAEWSKLQALAASELGDTAVDLVNRLPRMVDNAGREHIGWWLPRAFEAKQQISHVPSNTPASAEGLGLVAAVELSKHKKAFLSFCEARHALNDLGARRRWTRNYHAENQQKGKLPDPFDGISGAARMLAPGARIEAESVESLLAMEAVVIYDPAMDCYLDAQLGRSPLNKARLFSNAAEAEEVIERRHLTGCLTARVAMRVEGFSNPFNLGPAARSAWSEREAQTLQESTQDAPPSNSPRPRF